MSAIFILCLDLGTLLFSSILSGYISSKYNFNFYVVYDSFLLIWIICVLGQILLNCRLNTQKVEPINWYIVFFTFIIISLLAINRSYDITDIGLLFAAFLEEFIYRVLALSYLPIFFNGLIITIFTITIIFLANHIFVIYFSQHPFVSFIILLTLNFILIFLGLFLNFTICIIVHLLYDIIVTEVNRKF